MIKKVGFPKKRQILLIRKSESQKTIKKLLTSERKRTSRVDEIIDGAMLVPMIVPRYSLGNKNSIKNIVLDNIFEQKIHIRKHLSSLKFRLNSLIVDCEKINKLN